MSITLINKDCEAFVQQFAAELPYDYLALRFWAGDAEGKDDVWQRHTNRHWLNLCWWLALGGYFPQEFREALANNKVVVCGENFPEWAGEEGLNLPQLDTVLAQYLSEEINEESLMNLHIIGTLHNCETFTNPVQAVAFSKKYKPTIWVEKVTTELERTFFNELLAEAEVTKDDFDNFMSNVNAKYIDGSWQYIFKKYTEVKVRWDESLDTYFISINDNERELKRYAFINGVVINEEPHKLALIVLGYLLTAQSEVELTGRNAYLPSVYVDEVYVGYTHTILEQFRRNKVGLVQAAVRKINHFPILATGDNMIAAAECFEALGCSVFMHKGGKYIVVNAECAGFARNENQTKVAWYADKEAKLTGRNLFSVPTAALWID